MVRNLAVLMLLSYALPAVDLGVQGHLFPIEEPDLLTTFEEKLKALEESGQLATYNRQFSQKAEARIKNPPRVRGLRKTLQRRTFSYDPSIIVPYDLKDHEGRIIHQKGTQFNPLTQKNLNAHLVFIDGEDEEQIEWFKHEYVLSKKPAKLILIAGSPIELGRSLNIPCYFDQSGRLIEKFRIEQVPATVSQAKFRLKITEHEVKT